MAAIGATVQHFNEYQESIISITGITGAGTTPSFRSRTLVAGSFIISGTWATSTSLTAQLQGSNDNISYINIGVALSASSGTTPQGGSISPDGFFFSYYQFVITGGDAGTSLAIQIRLANLAD